MVTYEPRTDYLLRGRNGIETAVSLSALWGPFCVRDAPYMDVAVVAEILQRLNDAGIHYAIIGGVAMAHHAIPRATGDLDLMVLAEDASKVRELFPDCYLRGTAVAAIYEYKGTRFDVQPANLQAKASVIAEAVDDTYAGLPVKVAAVRHLILLKLWAIPDRPDPAKRGQDQVDVMGLIQHNAEEVSADDFAWIREQLLRHCYSPEECAKYVGVLKWLNGVLDELGLGDRKCPLD